MINGNLSKILLTGGVSALIGILGFMGSGIVNNDIRNTQQHIDIRGEMMSGDKATLDKVDKVKEIVTDIRIEQTEQRAILNEIKRKL